MSVNEEQRPSIQPPVTPSTDIITRPDDRITRSRREILQLGGLGIVGITLASIGALGQPKPPVSASQAPDGRTASTPTYDTMDAPKMPVAVSPTPRLVTVQSMDQARAYAERTQLPSDKQIEHFNATFQERMRQAAEHKATRRIQSVDGMKKAEAGPWDAWIDYTKPVFGGACHLRDFPNVDISRIHYRGFVVTFPDQPDGQEAARMRFYDANYLKQLRMIDNFSSHFINNTTDAEIIPTIIPLDSNFATIGTLRNVITQADSKQSQLSLPPPPVGPYTVDVYLCAVNRSMTPDQFKAITGYVGWGISDTRGKAVLDPHIAYEDYFNVSIPLVWHEAWWHTINGSFHNPLPQNIGNEKTLYDGPQFYHSGDADRVCTPIQLPTATPIPTATSTPNPLKNYRSFLSDIRNNAK